MSAPDPQTEPVRFYAYAVERQARGLGVLPPPGAWRVARERHLEMLRLRLVEGLTLRAIGERTGVSATRVRQLLMEYFQVTGSPSAGIVTAPAPFVPVLREAVVEGLTAAAGKIEDEGHAHPSEGIDPQLLEPFDAYRALLEAVGTAPAVAVQVNVSAHRWALETALREHLRLQRAFMDDAPEGTEQHRRAKRESEMIEAFIAGAGLRAKEA
jgi:hypothetical protein